MGVAGERPANHQIRRAQRRRRAAPVHEGDVARRVRPMPTQGPTAVGERQLRAHGQHVRAPGPTKKRVGYARDPARVLQVVLQLSRHGLLPQEPRHAQRLQRGFHPSRGLETRGVPAGAGERRVAAQGRRARAPGQRAEDRKHAQAQQILVRFQISKRRCHRGATRAAVEARRCPRVRVRRDAQSRSRARERGRQPQSAPRRHLRLTSAKATRQAPSRRWRRRRRRRSGGATPGAR